MPLAFHSLRQKLRNPSPLTGVFCELPCPEAVEIIGLAGWDFVVIDGEHAPLTAAQLPNMVRAASAAGIPAIVRVASSNPPAIQHALDAGARACRSPKSLLWKRRKQLSRRPDSTRPASADSIPSCGPPISR